MNIKKIAQEIRKMAKDDLKEKIFKFFKDNPNPKDDKIHEFAEKNNIDPHELESEIYSILSDYIENGTSVENWEGAGKNLTEKDVDPKEFALGMRIEMEHTKNPKISKRIVLDHLSEYDKYYSEGLIPMEQKLKEKK